MTCIYCDSTNIYPVQIRKNQSKHKQIMRCTDCKRRHTPDDGFNRHRHSPAVIALTLTLRVQQKSLEQTRRFLAQQFDVQVSRKTIHDWERKFSEKKFLIANHQRPITDEKLMY